MWCIGSGVSARWISIAYRIGRLLLARVSDLRSLVLWSVVGMGCLFGDRGSAEVFTTCGALGLGCPREGFP
mgnify:CR=1 FL=1